MQKVLGYNWKARQGKVKKVEERSSIRIEVDQSLFSSSKAYRNNDDEADTNAELLPSVKKQKLGEEDEKDAPKRKKLTKRRRKQLLKVVEAKERKAKHAGLLSNLSSLSLPKSHSALLQSSIQLGKANRTCKNVLNDVWLYGHLDKISKGNDVEKDGPVLTGYSTCSDLVGTTWKRKNRKRKLLKAEKVFYDPRPKPATPAAVSLDSDTDSDGDGSSESGDSDGDEDGFNENGGDAGDVNFKKEVPLSGIDSKGKGEARDSTLFEKKDVTRKDSTLFEKEDATRKESKDTGDNKSLPVQRHPVKYVHLTRDPDIQCIRLALPILSEEQVVMEAINDHPIVVLCGETGSGKTTQVPQFLYEAGYSLRGKREGSDDERRSLIGVTEPRRVAAVSMARRVQEEMGFNGSEVAYQIRYEGTTSADTEIKFMTDGVLLKEIEKDFELSRYSVVVIDEAHERSIYTDILIGLLSRIVPLREKNGNPLKLVIMSATLRVEDFTMNKLLFPIPPPVVRVDSRQYPVTVHFNRRTPDDYIDEAFRKACKIHRTLQPGSILIFVTGQKEVITLCRKLKRLFSRCDAGYSRNEVGKGDEGGDSDGEQVRVELEEEDNMVSDYNEDGSDGGRDSDEEEGISGLPMKVLPLYSLLSPTQQAQVFEPPPEGVRLCVVATNVAETSLTIPNVKYVVDTGKVKRRYYDKVTGVSTFRICWTSKASANQRAGRAGRTEPGHCYRLYSSAIFHNEFVEFSPPEITRRPVEDLVLQMKAMCIDKVINFPFPTPPSLVALNSAENLLHQLGALESNENSASLHPPLTITPLGRTMAQFPISPRYAKMLTLGRQHGCLPYVILLVSALSVKELFVRTEAMEGEEEGEEDEAKKRDRAVRLRRSWVGKGESLLLGDLMVMLQVIGGCEFSGHSEEFCLNNGVRSKAVQEVRRLRQQLTNIVNVICPKEELMLDQRLPPLSQEQARYMRQLVLAGLGDHVARKISTQGLSVEEKKILRYAYETTLCTDPVYIHSSSVLRYESPEFVVFQEITETNKLYMRDICAVDPSWLPLVQPKLCTFSPPLESKPPFFDDITGTVRCHMTCAYGDCSWSLGVQEMPYPETLLKYKLFAVYLLQGKVVKDLCKYSPFLLVAPIALLKTWSKLHKQCEILVAALANREVCSKEKLLAAWKEDSNFLLKPYSMWLPESKHGELYSDWPLSN